MIEKNFINLTNHPSEKWSEEQKNMAKKYGKIIDFPFPNVQASATEEYIQNLCNTTVDAVMKLSPCVVLCQGEFTLAFQIINRLLELGIVVVAACSERVVVEEGNRKESYFNFTKFRRFEKGD